MSLGASPTFREEVRGLLRDRLLDAAATVIGAEGWGAVTMAKLADEVGVSRQTVYNELGSKPHIAEALVMRELDRFLQIVRTRMSEQTEIVAAVQAGCEGALEAAEANPLLRTILESAHTGDSDLLPLLTTQAQGLIDGATAFVISTLAELGFTTGLDGVHEHAAIDAVIRLVLSHVMRPGKPAAQAAADIAWIGSQVLTPRA